MGSYEIVMELVKGMMEISPKVRLTAAKINSLTEAIDEVTDCCEYTERIIDIEKIKEIFVQKHKDNVEYLSESQAALNFNPGLILSTSDIRDYTVEKSKILTDDI